MKVLLVATVQSHICQFHKPLVKLLRENGAEVHVAARDNLAEKNGLKLDFADRVFDLPFSRSPKSMDNIKAYKELKKIIDRESYDIIHCNTPMGGIVTRLAAKNARKSGTKVFYTAHGFHFYKGAPKKNYLVFYPIEKFFANHFTDKLITITKEDYDLASSKFKTEVCHMHGVGVNEEKYLALSKEDVKKFKEENGYTDRFVILCTGELNQNKNQGVLIDAMPEVIKSHPEALLLIAGNGPAEKVLRDKITALDLDKNVKLIGYRTDLERYVNSCDLVISASKREGLPLNIMEAMVCQKPVLASNNRGHRELVKEGITGRIFKELTPECISDEIVKMIEDGKTREKYALASKEEVQKYTSKSITKELQKIYEF